MKRELKRYNALIAMAEKHNLSVVQQACLDETINQITLRCVGGLESLNLSKLPDVTIISMHETISEELKKRGIVYG